PDALPIYLLVLAAVARPVLGRAEDLLAEEPFPLGLQGPVVDGLGLLHLARRPGPNLLGSGQPDLDPVEVVHIKHADSPSEGPLPSTAALGAYARPRAYARRRLAASPASSSRPSAWASTSATPSPSEGPLPSTAARGAYARPRASARRRLSASSSSSSRPSAWP